MEKDLSKDYKFWENTNPHSDKDIKEEFDWLLKVNLQNINRYHRYYNRFGHVVSQKKKGIV